VQSVFTPRRYAKRGICRRHVSVCLSVYVSITLQYCIETAKRRIIQITPHDSHIPMTLVFLFKRSSSHHITWRIQKKDCLLSVLVGLTFYHHGEIRTGSPYLWGRQMQVGWVKLGHFRRKTRYNSKTVQDRRIVSIIVE